MMVARERTDLERFALAMSETADDVLMDVLRAFSNPPARTLIDCLMLDIVRAEFRGRHEPEHRTAVCKRCGFHVAWHDEMDARCPNPDGSL